MTPSTSGTPDTRAYAVTIALPTIRARLSEALEILRVVVKHHPIGCTCPWCDAVRREFIDGPTELLAIGRDLQRLLAALAALPTSLGGTP